MPLSACLEIDPYNVYSHYSFLHVEWFVQNSPSHFVFVRPNRARAFSFHIAMVLSATIIACSPRVFSHHVIEQAMNGFKERQQVGHDSNGTISVYSIWVAYHVTCIFHFYIDYSQCGLLCYDVRIYFSSPLNKLQDCFGWKIIDYTFLKIEVLHLANSFQEKHFVEFGWGAMVEFHIYL